MKCTSAEAGKMLRKLMEEKSSIEMREYNGKEFLAAVGEDLESVRPDYDFAKMQNPIPLTFVIKTQTFYFNLEKSKSSKQIPEFSSSERTSSNSVMPPVIRASTNNGKSTLFLISSWCLTSIFFASWLISSMCFSYSPYIDIQAQGMR